MLSLLRSAVRNVLASNPDYAHLSHLRVRSLSVYALALGLDEQHCNLQDLFSAAFLSASHEELPNLAALVADKFVQFRSLLPPPLDQTGFAVTSWNATSISITDRSPQGKLPVLQKHLKTGLVLVQETKLSEEEATALQLHLPNTLDIHTPALLTTPLEGTNNPDAQPGRSGGVAFLIPTYLLGATPALCAGTYRSALWI
jgi:hypothetical protein